MNATIPDLEVFKDIPGYKGILKAVLKHQIQLLVEQLSQQVEEESVVLSANIREGTFGYLGTNIGKQFLIDNSDVKRQYLSHCLKKHQSEKRKAEFLPSLTSESEVQPAKFIRTYPESSANFAVQKRPGFCGQRRNTRLRSGGKQFSSFYKGSSVLNSQRYGRKSLPTRESSGMLAGRTPEKPYERKLAANRHGSDTSERGDSRSIGVKTETRVRDVTQPKKAQTEPEVEVVIKAEPPDVIDETDDADSRAISEDSNMFGDSVGHRYTPDVCDDVSDGSQIYEYQLDQENDETSWKPEVNETICQETPWKPEASETVCQVTSKRKQFLPTRITKSHEIRGSGTILDQSSSNLGANSQGKFSQSKNLYQNDSTNQNSDWIEASSSITGITSVPSYRNKTTNERQLMFNQSSGLSDHINPMLAENVYSSPRDTFFSTNQHLTPEKNMGIFGEKSGYSIDADMSRQDDSYLSGGMKTFTKTPPIDGLFVSRGEGRFEKLITCEECGKVCRTSNMARHKKRYCTVVRKNTRSTSNYSRSNENDSMKSMTADLVCSSSNIYLDNPEKSDYCIDLTDSSNETDDANSQQRNLMNIETPATQIFGSSVNSVQGDSKNRRTPGVVNKKKYQNISNDKMLTESNLLDSETLEDSPEDKVNSCEENMQTEYLVKQEPYS